LLLYYITDRTQFPGREHERRQRLLEKIAEAARAGIDFVQLREKDLSVRELEGVTQEAMNRVRLLGSKTRLLINSRAEIALAAGADGVHLRAEDISPEDVRSVWRGAGRATEPVVAVSCHTDAEVIAAAESAASFVVFGPVFEKKAALGKQAAGLERLQAVCRYRVSVLALGGVTLENAHLCMQAGAAGIAGIRLFQEGDLSENVARLRS